ncbi:lonely Cys domain-containing protein, partial [Streptomyces sp. MCAF7]
LPEPAPWHKKGAPEPYLVGAVKGDHDHVMVPWPDGTERRASFEELAELLANDPDLPEGAPIVLAFPYSGGRGLELARLVAHRTGRDVWSFSGYVRVSSIGGNRRTIGMVKLPGRPFGDWIPSKPSDWRDPEENLPEWERHWVTHTVVSAGHEQLGRSSLQPKELAGDREEILRHLPEMTNLGHYNPVTKTWVGTPRPLKGSPPDYTFSGHGGPGFVEAAQDDGKSVLVPGAQFGRGLARRPSVRNLPKEATIGLGSCWGGAASDRSPDRDDAQEGAPEPFVADPLEN